MPSSDELVRAIEENAAEFLLALGRAGGGEERSDAGIHWTIGGSPIAYHNAVVRADLPPAEADRAIEASIERLRARGVPGCWHVGPSMRPGDLLERLHAHGFSGDDTEPGMAADLDSLADPPWPSGLVLDRVRSPDELERFRSVLAAGFGEGEPEANWVCATYARIGLGDETPWRHYLGRLGETAVSTVSVFHGAGVAGVYFVCTTPTHRRRGIGAATTLHALRAARAEGFRHAVLTSSPMGHGVYERLGFRQHCEIAVPEYDPRT